MLTFAVCDDNPRFAQALSKRIKLFCDKELPERIEYTMLPTFGSGLDVLEYLRSKSFNVLFLDIDMPEMNGFTLAEKLCKTHPEIIIIFVSAYEDFVYSSFEYSPFRFLRKAHLRQELDPTLQKVINKLVLDNETMSFITTDGEQIINTKLGSLDDTQVVISGSIGDLSDIKETDLACLLGNILDNAVDATRQAKEKRIELFFMRQNSNRIIICKNTTNNSVLQGNRELCSTKHDGHSHGYGTKIIKKIASDYNGMVEFFEDIDMFGVQVLLPDATT